jgi:hypothetical protein
MEGLSQFTRNFPDRVSWRPLHYGAVDSTKTQRMHFAEHRCYSRYIIVLVLSKVGTNSRHMIPYFRFPTVYTTHNFIWFMGEFCFLFASGIILKDKCEDKFSLSLTNT